MSLTAIIIIVLALGMILGGILLLRKSARKFDLSDEQLNKIKARNEAQDKKEEEGK